MSSARSRNYSSGRKRADLPRAGFQQHASARLERRTRRAHVVDQDDDAPLDVGVSPHRERIVHVGMTRAGGKVRLRNRGACALQCIDGRNCQVTRELRGLVESARAFSRSMKWHRHGGIRLCEHTRPAGGHQAGKRTRKRFAAVVLQRVNDRPQRSIVLADGASARDQMMVITASRAGVALFPDGTP